MINQYQASDLCCSEKVAIAVSRKKFRKGLKHLFSATIGFGAVMMFAGSASAQNLDQAIQQMNQANTALTTAAGTFSALSVTINGTRAGQEMFKKLILGGI